MPPPNNEEERPLLRHDIDTDAGSRHSQETHEIAFASDDEDNPKAWDGRKKINNVGIIALMAILRPPCEFNVHARNFSNRR